jgi:uncharacterized cofD-like protein
MKLKKIITIGGGTGSYTLLSGLKKYPVELSAIVSMADDGGSTGRLRDELGVLPPGDIRQCLVALSESPSDLRELMQYRFTSGDLKGHSFGNIFVSALEKTYGSLSRGAEEAGKILNVRGRVIPVTEGDMRIESELEDGTILYGEDELDENEKLRKYGVKLKYIRLKKRVRAHIKALEAIKKADVIIFGPADHFSNIIPSLLVEGFAKAIADSHAQVFSVANLTNKRGLTDGWTVDKYIHSIEKYIGKGRVNAAIFNTSRIDSKLLKRYESEEGRNSLVKLPVHTKRSFRVVKARIAASGAAKHNKYDAVASSRSFIRHDSDKLAKAIILYLEMEGQKIIEDVV